ncbi:MAG TPA: DUF952 domain-containing protein [Micropepsaceae bacterium]|nr:DUF952 domain-containing protein [Micropepsaceae bacterium]
MSPCVYKLFRQSEWHEAARTGLFTGSADDRRDGFIHLSAASQVRGTFEKYFAAEREPVLAGFDADSFGAALKWEISRNGEQFPHLYGVLDLARALSVSRISRDRSGAPAFPTEIPVPQ